MVTDSHVPCEARTHGNDKEPTVEICGSYLTNREELQAYSQSAWISRCGRLGYELYVYRSARGSGIMH